MLKYQYYPITVPDKGAGGKTGNWRVVRPLVNKSKCIGCKACFLFCPEDTIKIDESDGKVYVDYDYCKGCGVCSNVCPVKAIEMVSEA